MNAGELIKLLDGTAFTELRVIDIFAILAPEPSDAAINHEGEIDRMRNPHGDPYKPKRRSGSEICAELRYRYAAALMNEGRNWGQNYSGSDWERKEPK